MSLKPMPGSGKSGTSRIFDLRSIIRREPAHVAPEEQLGELLRRLPERLEVVDPGAAALRVPRAERRRDERLEQPRLAVGRRAERAQVPRRDAVARQRLARGGDVGVRLRVDALAALDARLEQPELLQLAGALAARCRRARGAPPGRAPPPSRRARRRASGAAPCRRRWRAPRGSRAAAGTRRAGGGGSSRAARRRPRRRAGSRPASASASSRPWSSR